MNFMLVVVHYLRRALFNLPNLINVVTAMFALVSGQFRLHSHALHFALHCYERNEPRLCND